MKVRYVGISFGVDSLTDGKIYECVGIELPFIRIIDDSGEDYLYSASIPSDLTDPDKKGRWEIVEDDDLCRTCSCDGDSLCGMRAGRQ